MKKICILQNGLARGGTDTFVVNLCRGLDKNRYDITVINPSDKSGSRVRESDIIEAEAKIIHTTQLGSLKGKIKHLIQLYKILKRGRFEVFQTNIDLFNGPNLFVAWLAGVPVRCCHSHNGSQQKQLTEGASFSVKTYQKVMKWLCWRFSNRRCGCSEAAMDFLYAPHHWHTTKYPVIINNGLDLSAYSQSVDVVAKKKELNLDAKYNIIAIGHLIPQKNPLFIARIFTEICKIRKNCDLIWVGDGILKTEVMEILNKGKVAERVHFLNNRADIPEILHCGDVFILPSNFEGLGIVAIEAQAAGLPCVLSDRVPKEADCGAAVFLPIDSDGHQWIDTLCAILDGHMELVPDKDKLSVFSIKNMASQMSKVFE